MIVCILHIIYVNIYLFIYALCIYIYIHIKIYEHCLYKHNNAYAVYTTGFCFHRFDMTHHLHRFCHKHIQTYKQRCMLQTSNVAECK